MVAVKVAGRDLGNVEHEARLTGSLRSMLDRGWNYGDSFELGAGQPLLSMRLLATCLPLMLM